MFTLLEAQNLICEKDSVTEGSHYDFTDCEIITFRKFVIVPCFLKMLL